MTRHPLIKTAWVLFAALFLTVQGLSQAHAITNGGVDHSHDGVACDVALVAAEQAVITPPADIPALVILPSREIGFIAPTSFEYRQFEGRAPPPRGPPLTF